MALATLAADLVEITYEKSLNNRPICPSISHWKQSNNLQTLKTAHEFVVESNQEPAFGLSDSPKKIQGMNHAMI